MLGSVIVYFGLVMVTAGLVLVVKPIQRLRVTTRCSFRSLRLKDSP